MSVKATFNFILTVTETLSSGLLAANQALTYNALNGVNGNSNALSLDGTTTPAVSQQMAFQAAVTTSMTLDLRALACTDGVTRDGNGKKVVGFMLENPSTNTNAITLAIGASNGYGLLGAAFSITLQPGEKIENLKAGTQGVVIDATHKTIDVTCTGTQTLNGILVLG